MAFRTRDDESPLSIFPHRSTGMMSRVAAALLLLAVAACASGQPPVSKPAASQAPTASQVASILAVADATRTEGRFAEAMQIYQEVLVSDPTAVAAQYGVAECLLALGRPGDAGPMFKALAQDPGFHAVAVQGQGLALLVLGQRADGAKLLREAVEADPKLWRSYNGLGLFADLKRQPDEAADDYAKALASTESAAVFNNMGYSRLLAGKPDEAIVSFKKALGLEPNSETILNNLRLAIAAKGNYGEALRTVPREQMAATLNNVGYIAMQRGDLHSAEGYFARSMENSSSFNTVAARNLEQLKSLQSGGEE
jgi:Flp pilus assembly protein TadD